ncbi:MAG: transposase [Pseudomonadota bacterium]
MPNYRRLYVPGGTYFLTVCLADRNKDTLVREVDALRAAWRDVATARAFESVAAVVLPDHMHFIWRLPEDDADFSTRLSMLKAGFTRRLRDGAKQSGRKGERGVWQSRFWEHLIRNEDDLSRHLDYIHFNPVKHGFVDDPDDWPYSTWHDWKREIGRPIEVPPEDWQPVHLGERF